MDPDPPPNDEIPRKQRVMPKTKKKFGRRVSRNGQRQPVILAVPQDHGISSIGDSVVSSSSEQSRPYKKMRVEDCRLKLVDKDDEIAKRNKEIEQLKLALEATKKEHQAKDADIAERREAMEKMSKDLQASRRACNLMLADQRELNTQVAEDAKKKVAASKRDQDTVVAQAKDEAAALVLLSISDRDSKIAKALLDKKRVIQAKRQYCQERRNETTAKVNSKLFAEIVVHGDIVTEMKDQRNDLVAHYQLEAAKHKCTINAQKSELSAANVQSKSAAQEKRKIYLAQLQEKNASINMLEKEYGGNIDVLVDTCKQLISGFAAAGKDVSKSNMAAEDARATASRRLEQARECQEKISELQDCLILESQERYKLALDNEVLKMTMQEMKDDYERRIRELTPRILARDWNKKGAWPNWVIQLVVELLSHRTPPSCVSANIISVLSLVCPNLINNDKNPFLSIQYIIHQINHHTKTMFFSLCHLYHGR